MRVARIDARIGVDAQLLLQPALDERLQLQPETVDDLAGRQRQTHQIAALGLRACGRDRAGLHGRKRAQPFNSRRVMTSRDRRDLLRRAERELPHTGQYHLRWVGHNGSGKGGSQNAGSGGKREETTPSHGVVIILRTRYLKFERRSNSRFTAGPRGRIEIAPAGCSIDRASVRVEAAEEQRRRYERR